MSFPPASNNVQIKTSDEANNSLNELFQVVYDKSNCRQKPLNERQLPLSFFVPPSGIVNQAAGTHFKAFSSPATLEETYRAGHGHHMVNHLKQLSLDSQNGTQNISEINNLRSLNVRSHSPAFESKPHLDIELKKLPEGYEMAVNENCQVYFLDHNAKVTTWFDPRIPEDAQKWGMKLSELQNLHIHFLNQQNNTGGISPSHNPHQQQQQKQQHHSQQSGSNNLEQQHSHNSSSASNSGFGDIPCSHSHLRSCSQPVSSSGTSLGTSLLFDNSLMILNSTNNSAYPMASSTVLMQHQTSSPSNNNHNTLNSQPQQQLQYYYHDYNSVAARRGYHKTTAASSSHNSSSHNSSCSNLSSCLNGLNLSPSYPPPPLPPPCHHHSHQQQQQQHHSQQQQQQQQHLHISHARSSHNHSHQDSLDSGVGQSVISQTNNTHNIVASHGCPDHQLLDSLTIKIEDRFNSDCLDDKPDDLMDIEIYRPTLDS